MRIIGIGGTNGSGKDTIAELLESEYDFLFVSGSEMLRQECRRRGLTVDRANLRQISSEWRHDMGLGAIIDKALDVYTAKPADYVGVVIASLRNPGEAARVHQLGGKVWWIDADPEVRYQRIIGTDRGRLAEDSKTYAQFLEEEAAEMHPAEGADATALHTAAVRDMADTTILNEGSVEDLSLKIAKLVS